MTTYLSGAEVRLGHVGRLRCLLHESHRDPGLAAAAVLRHFKDAVYPFFESDTLFLECCVVSCC